VEKNRGAGSRGTKEKRTGIFIAFNSPHYLNPEEGNKKTPETKSPKRSGKSTRWVEHARPL